MQLPAAFEHRVVLTFREEGKHWLKRLDEIVSACAGKWRLTELKTAETLSYNYVCYGMSEIYGEVVLKISVPNSEFFSEVNALKWYDGKGICQILDYSRAYHAMLLEKVSSSKDLRTVDTFEERVAIAAGLLRKMHGQAGMPDDTAGFQIYERWLDKAFYFITHEKVIDDLSVNLETSKRYYQELKDHGGQETLLHGDLHHMNILKDQAGYKIIDPKGVIGIKTLDCARFIQNEINLFVRDDLEKRTAVRDMIREFARALDTKEPIVFRSLYIDTTLSTCWHMEDDELTSDGICALAFCRMLENMRVDY